MKISELTDDQKSHLAWRLEHNTGYGIGASCAVARGEAGDLEIVDAFVRADKSRRSALILAKKVENFKVNERDRAIGQRTLDLSLRFLEATRGIPSEDAIVMAKRLISSIKSHIPMLEMMAEKFPTPR